MTVAELALDLRLHASGDHVSDVIRETGDYFERPILDEIRRRVEGGVLIDVGAHIGNHAVYLARNVRHSAIHAFEPSPQNLPLLRWNTALLPSVTVHDVALGDRTGTALLTLDPTNHGHDHLNGGTIVFPGGGTPVRMTTLDSFGFRDVTLLKVDAEGHEPEVFAGARDTIARCRPLIVVEDWTRSYGALLPGYRLAAEWETAHQTFLYEPVG